MTENTYFTTLPNRGLLHIEGDDRHDFLQNLITNDVHLLEPGKAIYACLLTPQGKFLHDFFVSEGDTFILIECEGNERARDLFELLSAYKLRANVQISVEENIPVYVLFGAQTGTGYLDPRDPEMGYRSLERPNDLEEKPFKIWDQHRICLCIPDGSRDMIPEQSTMDEAHIEKLAGISYDKGCFVGQELTARMHYRGLGKKHLYAVEGNNLPDPGNYICINHKSIGIMRSRSGNLGLALIKDADLKKLDQALIKLLNS